jgi:hypothetical protein
MCYEFRVNRPYYILMKIKYMIPKIKEEASVPLPETFEVLKA